MSNLDLDTTTDTRDIIERLEGLRDLGDSLDADERKELELLESIESEAQCSPDWEHGEALINSNYFTKYIEELIDDCYSMPEGIKEGSWPFRHMTMDYEAAAEEAKVDYTEFRAANGSDFLIRG